MSLLILLFCVKNLRVEMGYEQIITIMKKKFFEPSWSDRLYHFPAKYLAKKIYVGTVPVSKPRHHTTKSRGPPLFNNR